MSITRRLFLRNTAAAGAVAVTVAAPVIAAEPEMTDRERAIWHLRELKRLAIASGAAMVTISICGHRYGGKGGVENCKIMILRRDSDRVSDHDGMFAVEGGEA